jgi:pimeloyl-ACP methyl ester carboxylesterase
MRATRRACNVVDAEHASLFQNAPLLPDTNRSGDTKGEGANMPKNTTVRGKFVQHLLAGAMAAFALGVNAQQITTSVSYSPATGVATTTVNTAVKVTGAVAANGPSMRTLAVASSSTVSTTSQGWAFTGKVPQVVPLPFDDDLDIPIPVGIAEYTLSDPAKGFFRFQGGRVESAVRVPLDTFALNVATRTQRPTLFVSIPGASFDGVALPALRKARAETDPWQETLARKLSPIINVGEYKYYMVTWDSAVAMGYQVRVLADYVKAFLGPKVDAWDVVLIGHSRGGVFAHELSKRLAGFSKVSSLHVWMLDPTAGPMFGDIYPTRRVDGGSVFGYLKYDSYPFYYSTFGTVGDTNVEGYDNYGNGVYEFRYPGSTSENSHAQYASNWLNLAGTTTLDGFAGVMQRFNTVTKQPGTFVVDGQSGNEIVRIGAKDLSADMFANCQGGTCNISGSLSIGSIGSVAFNNMLATDGLDVAVATTTAAVSTVIRQDYATVAASDMLTGTSTTARIDSGGITVNATVLGGQQAINAELNLTGADVSVRIGDVNIPIISLNPISPVKSIIKKFKF